MQYNDEIGQFEGDTVNVPDDIEVVEFDYGDIQDEAIVVPVVLEDQMAQVVGYGVCFWDEGNQNEEYPDESRSHRNHTGKKQTAVKRAIKKAEREDAVLANRVAIRYE